MQQAILTGLAKGDRQSVIDARLDDVATRLGRLKQAAETSGVPVILVQHDGDPGHRLETGSGGWQFRREVAPAGETIVVHKQSCDAFHDTNLGDRLKQLGIDHLVIGGCMTQFCVDTTTRRAVSEGFDVTLVQDGHATADFGTLSADQIVDHHNALLSGFDAGSKSVGLKSAQEIDFLQG
jgi:nicotinamidase-related amidase